MRGKKFFYVITAIAALLALHLGIETAQAFQGPSVQKASSAPASATEVKVGLGVENMDLSGASDAFKIAPDTKIYAWARVRGIAPGTSVTVAFSKGDKEVFRKEIPVPSVPYRIFSYRTFRSADAGDWKVVVAGADGKELASTAFKVDIAK